MTAPIGLQLYSIREAMSQDFRSAITRVANTGYIGVETAGFPGITPKEAMKFFDSLGLQVCGAHSPMPTGDKKNEVIDTMGILGNPPLIVPWQPPELFESMDGLNQLAEDLHEAHEISQANGFRLGYHNHHAEMHLLEGRPALTILSEMVDPEIFFEIDTYWAQTGGVNAVELLQKMGAKAPFLHVKDGPCVRGEPNVALGEGIMDIKAIVRAGEPHTEWLIVEFDACATEMFEAIEKSYTYLTQEGLAHGRK